MQVWLILKENLQMDFRIVLLYSIISFRIKSTNTLKCDEKVGDCGIPIQKVKVT